MGTVLVTSSETLNIEDQIVVSVGPYMFHNSRQRGRSSEARSAGSASPPHNAFNLGAPFQPESTNIRQVAGVACNTVGSELASRRFSLSTWVASSREAMI